MPPIFLPFFMSFFLSDHSFIFAPRVCVWITCTKVISCRICEDAEEQCFLGLHNSHLQKQLCTKLEILTEQPLNLNLLYPPNGFLHVKSLVGVALRASSPYLEKLQHLIQGVRVSALQLWINTLRFSSVGDCSEHPVHHVGATLAIAVILRREFPGDHLKNDDSQAVNVGFLCHTLVCYVIWSFVRKQCLYGVVVVDQRMKGEIAQESFVILS